MNEPDTNFARQEDCPLKSTEMHGHVPRESGPDREGGQSAEDSGRRLGQHIGITSLLIRIRNGIPLDSGSTDFHLLELVNQEVREIANQAWLRLMGGGLPASDLVNVAWLKILKAKKKDTPWQNREHFFNTVAKTMQQAIVDRLRRRGAQKRQGVCHYVGLELQNVPRKSPCPQISDVSDALNVLSERDPDAATVFRLKFFGGNTLQQIAELRETTYAQVYKDWVYAKTWINARLSDTPGS